MQCNRYQINDPENQRISSHASTLLAELSNVPAENAAKVHQHFRVSVLILCLDNQVIDIAFDVAQSLKKFSYFTNQRSTTIFNAKRYFKEFVSLILCYEIRFMDILICNWFLPTPLV